MNQYSQNKIKGLGTGPKFEKENKVDFYVPVGAILIELDFSDKAGGIESKILGHDGINFSKDSVIVKQYTSSVVANGN